MQEIKKINLSLEFSTVNLNDIVSLVIDYRGKTPKKLGFDWSEKGIRALSAKNIKNGKIIREDTIRYVDNALYKKWMKEEIRRNDILITSEAPFGEVFFWDSDEKIVLSQRLFGVRCDENKVYSKFIYFYMISEVFQWELESRATGTTVKGLRQPELLKCKIQLPNIIIQRKISYILSNIEDKIECLENINKNLEEQIETIYNSFFVYYDDFLKEELEECEIGFIPKDWNLMTLGQITTQIKEKVGKNNYKVFSAVNTGNLILSEEYFDKQVFSKSIEKYIVVKQNEFAYNPARINIGSIGRNDFDYEGCVSPVYVAFKVEEGYENFMNMFIKSKRFNQWVITLSSGSVRQTLNYNDFSIIKIAYPPKSLVNKFNVIYESYYEVINYNKSVIHNLEEIRDTLLPKLMSGEIDVSKINCDLELKYNYMKYLFNQIYTQLSKSVV